MQTLVVQQPHHPTLPPSSELRFNREQQTHASHASAILQQAANHATGDFREEGSIVHS